MDLNNIIYKKEGHKAIVTINRPEALNALNSRTIEELDAVISEVEADTNVYVVIITGAGEKAFAAGADILEMKKFSVAEARHFSRRGNEVFRRLETLGKPVIAAVNGFALGGGCELALACDIRIASDTCRFGQPEVGLGITPGFGGTQRLARTVGLAMAKEMIYSARTVKAEEALKAGIVNRVASADKLMHEAMKLADTIAGHAPIAVRLSKEAIDRGAQMDIDTAIHYEAELFGQCFSTLDQKEGMSAFIEKRAVKNFQNK